MEDKRDVELKINAINERLSSLKEILERVYLRRGKENLQ